MIRYFWKTMRTDVVQWINSCSQCSRKKKKNPENQTEPECVLEALRSPQIPDDLDRWAAFCQCYYQFI